MRLTLICIAGLGWTDWQPRDGDGWQVTPLLWPNDLGTAAAAATLATGALPERHGVIGDDEGWALGTRPVSQASWRVQPIWTALAATGMTTASLDWPASSPGRNWCGLHVDDRFAAATGHSFDSWTVPPGALPNELDVLRDLRVHPAELTGEQLLPIVPGLASIDQARTHSVEQAARALARAATVQAAALHMLGATESDLLAVHFSLPEALRSIGDGRVTAGGGQIFIRAAIERLHAAAPDRTMAVIGYGPSGEAGVIATRGLASRPPPRATDLAYWFVTLFGTAYAPAETPPKEDSVDPRTRGYAHPPGPPASWQASRLALLARQLLSRSPASSRQLIEQALAAAPDSIDALRVKALCEAAAEAAEPLAEVGKRLEALAPAAPWGPLARALADSFAGEKTAAAARLDALDALDAGSDQQFWTLIGTAWLAADDPRRAKAAFARAPDRTDALLGLVQAAMARRDFRLAESRLTDALERHPVSRAAHLLLAELYDELGRSHEAAAARQRAAALVFG